MSRRTNLLICLSALLALTIMLPARFVYAQETLPRAIIIIDGSGSMWGRIDGREKIVIARNSLANKLQDLKEMVNLGVMSYGHRRRRDCRDIETILPIGPVDVKTYSKAIRRLLPRGKTPVSQAITNAVKSLGPAIAGQKAHIILVADGAENCRLDPCKTASTIARQRPDISIEVVAFGAQQKELSKISCIATNTNGAFYKTSNASELNAALDKVIANLKGSTVKSPPVVKKPQKPKIPAGLYLSAGLAETGPQLQKDVSWRIYKQGERSQDGATPLLRKNTPTPVLKLAAGDYHIEARYGPLLAEKDISLKPEKAIKSHFSFNAGILRSKAQLGESAMQSEDVILSLYSTGNGAPGPNNVISHKQESQARFYLPPGKYALKARLGEAETTRNVVLQAGKQVDVDLLLQAGHIDMSTRLAEGGSLLDGVQYALYRQRPDGSYRAFIRTLDPQPKLVLPVGDYLVHAQKDAAYTTSPLRVMAGERKSLSLVLQAAILSLSASFKVKDAPAQSPIAYTIEATPPLTERSIVLANNRQHRLDRRLPVRSSRRQFVLPAGSYRIRALYGSSNAEVVQTVQLKAGETHKSQIDMRAGQISLSLTLASGSPPLPGVFWSIFDANGKQVASASRTVPRLTLQQGRYKVVADYLGNTYKQEFDIKNRDDKQLVLKVE